VALPLTSPGIEAAQIFPPRSWAEIDLSAIRHNVRSLRRHIYPSQVVPVVKADAYGLGAIPIAKAALDAGAAGCAVATVEEGIELRRAGIVAPLLVLGYAPVEVAPFAAEYDLTLTVYSLEMAMALSRAATRRGRRLPVHLKLDTGLNRFGLNLQELLKVARYVSGQPCLQLQGLYSHFATSDDTDTAFVHEQLRRFEHGRKVLESHNLHFPQVHMSNSAGGIRFGAARNTFVRFGLAFYGYYPSAATEAEARAAGLHLRPSLTLKSVLASVNELAPGETVGYSRTYTATEERCIGLVPVGYADGYRRALSNRAHVLVGERRVPVIGRVSMDQFTVDLTDVPDAQEGDEVVLIGAQGNASVPLEEIAQLCDTIPYEVLTGLGRRIRRTYTD
jgi:alanine racemase